MLKVIFIFLFAGLLSYADSKVFLKTPQVVSNGRFFAIVGLKKTQVYEALSATEVKKIWLADSTVRSHSFILTPDGKYLIETAVMPASTAEPVIYIHSKAGTKKMYMKSFIEDERKIQRTVTMIVWLQEKTVLKGNTIIVTSRDKTLTVDYVKGKIVKKEDTKVVSKE